ncbi:hypothetical protein GSI_11468 [Ganoderma sinense ZZ0214-1]|uniref:Uncharacterized protein n=1 Tax=Ganoderma sinense ZZ0214-1 TaxID=1077348 RepID=A0A2G8RWM6_9APHY|nr:hypothetical protein GSI_11468 [Ganoderma sinense ZZ0214-1]
MVDTALNEFTLDIAEDECDRLVALVEDAFAHQVAGRIANFAMIVGADTETEEELKPLLHESVRTLEIYHWVTGDHVHAGAWLADLRTSAGRCPEDYGMIAALESSAQNLIARLAVQRADARMREFVQLRERALRVRRMATFVTGLPTDTRERAERLTNYLCEPATANLAGVADGNQSEPETAGIEYEEPATDYEL